MAGENVLGFLGGGQMATALARGGVVAKIFKNEDLVFCEPSSMQRSRLSGDFPEAKFASNPTDLFRMTHRVILAVKPQVLREIGSQLNSITDKPQLIVSIAAGVSLYQLQEILGSHRVIRVMPNTPCQVLAGASGIAAGIGATPEDIAWTERLMNGVGISVRVPDNSMHAVTAVSGSGPAYVLTMIEALADGGVAVGLSRDMALQLAAQTVYGTAKMLLESKMHPAALRDQVVSPAGTTIAALRVLEQSGIRSSLIEAVIAAARRSEEIANDASN